MDFADIREAAPARAVSSGRLRRRIGSTAAWLVAALAFTVAHARVGAQESSATPPIPPGHWAYAALDRLAAAGLIDGEWAIGHQPQSAGAMESAFRSAQVRATEDGSPLADFARTSAQRFAREYAPSHDARGGSHVAVREATFRATGTTGAATGFGAVEIGVDVTASLGRHLALSYGPAMNVSAGATTVEHPRVTVVGKLGSWWATAGRQRFSFGPATGGLILNGASSFGGVMLGSDGAVRIGGVGRLLGPLHATAVVSRLPGDTLGKAAWFVAARVSLSPHPRVRIGLTRTALVAGNEHGDVGLSTLLMVMAGMHSRPNVEDQRASVDLSVALGGRAWRVVPYFEWGFEDTAGAYVEDPGVTAGAYMPFVPGLPDLSLRYEYTAFGESARMCWFCNSRITKWYRHSSVRSAYIGGDGLLIGHPLGGYGYEHRVDVAHWLAGGNARIHAALVRRRREPLNLLYESRPGASRGLGIAGSYRILSALTVDTSLWWESGDAGWRDAAASIGAQLRID
ncbi:MAG: capsule assembly Wzi family protein [Longimicrobiales bacterium]